MCVLYLPRLSRWKLFVSQFEFQTHDNDIAKYWWKEMKEGKCITGAIINRNKVLPIIKARDTATSWAHIPLSIEMQLQWNLSITTT